MLTYPRFARACYALFAVAVLAAVLKLSILGVDPALLKILPATPTASAVEPAAKSPEAPEDPRLESFSDDGETELIEATFSRASRVSPREDVAARDDQDPDVPSGDAHIFRRPSLQRGSSPEPVCGDLGDAPRSSRVVFPLPKSYFNSYDDTWGAARPQGGHEGSDLMGPAGTPEFALTDGELVAVAGSNENGWNRLGGYTVMLEAAYDIGPIKKGDLFYYAHMDRKSSLPLGTEVRAGQRIGTVGDTGEGQEVTRGKFPPHLHLGWYDADLSERSEAESGAMDPYPLLLWLESNGGAVSGGTDASYCQAPQSPVPAPSTGEPDWPTPSAPGERPDLDTGGDAASPAVQARHQDHPKRRHDEEGNGEGGKGNGEGETRNGEEKASDEGNGTEGTGRAQDEAKELSPRKKLKMKLDIPLRDFPSGVFDRNPTEDQSDESGDRGREHDGRNDEEQGEHPGKIDRSEGKPDAPPKKPPKPTAPVAAPVPEPRPVPEKPGEEDAAKEEPEADTPPDAVETPITKPVPVPDTEGTEATAIDPPTREETGPVSEETLSVIEGKTVAGSEPGEGK